VGNDRNDTGNPNKVGKPEKYGDGNHGGPGGTNRGHFKTATVPESGSPMSNDGAEKPLPVKHIRISGSQDPRDTHK
jgi:hypothetical protein